MIFYAYFSFNTTNYYADASQNLRKKNMFTWKFRF